MIITRFAPSPTGFLHIGSLRTALFSWLWAKQNNGKFLLRIEDTDLARNKEDTLKGILESFEWTNIKYDEEPIYQSQRFEIYNKYIDKLLDEDKAYRCYMGKDELEEIKKNQIKNGERAKYNRKYRDFKGDIPKNIDYVVRIKAPLNQDINFKDGVKGDIKISSDEIDDFIIARSDGTPTYNFVVVVDDYLMNLTDIIRGDDHLYNTPKQITIYNALNFKIPNFYHLAMINDEDGKKLSKRKNSINVMDYKKNGFLPEAILNFIVRLGWSYKEQEIFSVDEMINLFNPKDINKSSSNFNIDKLLWLNSHYIKNMLNSKLIEILKSYNLDISKNIKKNKILDATKERAKTLIELKENINFILNRPNEYDHKNFKKIKKEKSIDILTKFIIFIKIYKIDNFKNLIESFIEQNSIKFGEIGQPLRISLLGRMTGAGLNEIIDIIGIDETITRVNNIILALRN